MPRTSDARRLRHLVANTETLPGDDPPPGPVGSDRDGAYVYFGANPCWTPHREGQRAAIIPAPTNNSAHDPTTCPTCNAALADPRVTCMGCLTAGIDTRLNEELVRDAAAAEEKAKRLAEQRAAEIGHDFATRKFGRESSPAA